MSESTYVVSRKCRDEYKVLGAFSSRHGAERFLGKVAMPVYRHVGHSVIYADNQRFTLPHDHWSPDKDPYPIPSGRDEVTDTSFAKLSEREGIYLFCYPGGGRAVSEDEWYRIDKVAIAVPEDE